MKNTRLVIGFLMRLKSLRSVWSPLSWKGGGSIFTRSSEHKSSNQVVPGFLRQVIMLRTVLAVLVIGITTQIQAQSVDWKEVFPVRKHNFGTVAVAAKTEFRFPVKNESAQTIHIRKVRASCGCTTPIVESSTMRRVIPVTFGHDSTLTPSRENVVPI